MTGESVPEPVPAVAPTFVGRLWQTVRTDARRLTTTGVPHLFVALLLTQGISMLRRIVLTRLLSVDELGQMTYVMQIADLLAVVVDLGLTTALLKYAAEPIPDTERRRLYCSGLQWGVLTSCAGAAVYMVVVLLARVPADQVLRTYMLMVTPYIPLAALAKIPIIFMQARKEIKRSARFTMLTQALSLVVLIGATWAFGLRGFFAAVIVAPLSNLSLLLAATRRELRWYAPSIALFRKMLTFGFTCLLANSAGFATPVVTVVLLRHLTGSDEQVGLYAVALLVMNATRLLPQALMQTAFPYLSGLLDNPLRLRARVRELAIKQTLVVAGLWLAWLLVGRQAIAWVLGARFVSAFGCSVVLMLTLLPYAVSAAAAQGLLALGAVRMNLLGDLTLLSLNALGCWLWIPRQGVLGAALAVVGAQMVATCVVSFLFRRVVARKLRHVPAAPLVGQAQQEGTS